MIDHLQSQLSALPEGERAELAKFLIGTLSPVDENVDAAWDAEIERRLAEIESGAVALKPADVFLAELDERYP
jgi:putative addiction module component (TIGR02574 family)